MLQPGDIVPHFQVTNLQGGAVSYSSIWQRRNLVLVTLPVVDADQGSSGYVTELLTQGPAATGDDTAWVITHDTVSGVPCPGAVVADRWGEIIRITAASHVGELPRAQDLVEWVTYVQHRCPECEGESR